MTELCMGIPTPSLIAFGVALVLAGGFALIVIFAPRNAS